MEVLHRVVCGTARHTEFAPSRPTLPQLRALPRDEGGDYGTLAGGCSLRGSSSLLQQAPLTLFFFSRSQPQHQYFFQPKCDK